MPADFTTFAHFSRSVAMNLVNSAGEVTNSHRFVEGCIRGL